MSIRHSILLLTAMCGAIAVLPQTVAAQGRPWQRAAESVQTAIWFADGEVNRSTGQVTALTRTMIKQAREGEIRSIEAVRTYECPTGYVREQNATASFGDGRREPLQRRNGRIAFGPGTADAVAFERICATYGL